MRNQQFRVTRERLFGDDLVIRFAEIIDERHITVAKPVVLEIVERGTMNPDEAMIAVNPGAAQSLMDELWAVGVRPSDIGTAGHLAATQAHLNDVQAILQAVLPVALREKITQP